MKSEGEAPSVTYSDLQGGYTGEGNEERIYSLRGLPIGRIQIPEAKGGWSMIGAGTYSSHPSLENGDIRAIFGFSGKYVFLSPEDYLEPGRGYWINLSGPTILRIETGN